MSSTQLAKPENIQDELESSSKSEIDSFEQYKELEQIYNKLIVTNGNCNANYGPPTQRTLIPGAHARKLGIRLKTAKQLSEKQQTNQQRLKTAAPRLRLLTQEKVNAMASPFPPELFSRSRVSTAFTNSSPMQTLLEPVDRSTSKSAPPGRIRNFAINSTNKRRKFPDATVDIEPRYSSLAMYSPQTQRFTMEQLALEQTRVLKRLSHIQTHRVEKRFYVSGAPCDLKERYEIDEEQYALLMEITNKGKSTNQHLASLSLSNSVLRHFSPQLASPRLTTRPLFNPKAKSKRVSMNVKSGNRTAALANTSPSETPFVESHKILLQTERGKEQVSMEQSPEPALFEDEPVVGEASGKQDDRERSGAEVKVVSPTNSAIQHAPEEYNTEGVNGHLANRENSPSAQDVRREDNSGILHE